MSERRVFAILFNPTTREVVEIAEPFISAYDDAYSVRSTDGRELAMIYLNVRKWIKEKFVRIHVKSGLRDEVQGKGYGTLIYLGGAIVAGALGFRGIYSISDDRSIKASRVWVKLAKLGLATLMKTRDEIIDVLPAQKAKKSRMVIAAVGYRADPNQVPADLAVRAKVRSMRDALRIFSIVRAAYGQEAANAFGARKDVQKLVQMELPLRTKWYSMEGLAGFDAIPIMRPVELPPLSAKSREIISLYQDM